jgi:hypothetical protein
MATSSLPVSVWRLLPTTVMQGEVGQFLEMRHAWRGIRLWHWMCQPGMHGASYQLEWYGNLRLHVTSGDLAKYSMS